MKPSTIKLPQLRITDLSTTHRRHGWIGNRTRAWPLAGAFVGILFACAPGHAYEADVHFGLTRWLALMTGFSTADAGVLADANNGLDGIVLSAVPIVAMSACVTGNAAGANSVRENHFATHVAVPNSPAARAVTPGNHYAMTRAMDRIRTPLEDRRANLLEFGARLHAVQDTWSHKSIPDVPRIWPVSCRADYAWSHSKDWGGWRRHDADLTWMRIPDADAMAMATYNLMCKYRAEIDKVPCAKSWGALAKDVRFFNGLKTKGAKRDWFMARGFKEAQFIQDTSLPESDRPAPPLPYLVSPYPFRSVMDAAPRDEIGQFFARFLTAWATTDNFDQLIETFIDPVTFGTNEQGSQLLPFNVEIAKLTLQYWRALDHGRVALFGHDLPSMNAETRKLLFAALGDRGMLQPYEDASQALLPANADRAPFALELTKSASGEDVYLAYLRFRHARNDGVIVSAQKSPKRGLRINAIQSLVDH